jgi:hypothetical protein
MPLGVVEVHFPPHGVLGGQSMEAGPDAAHPSCFRSSLSVRILAQDADVKDGTSYRDSSLHRPCQVPRHQQTCHGQMLPHTATMQLALALQAECRAPKTLHIYLTGRGCAAA